MFTLNDLLDQVTCCGQVSVRIILSNGDIKEVFKGEDLGQIPYKYGSKELAYIYAEDEVAVYEVND